MSSFFAAIQNWFVADLHGRHLALILLEIGRMRAEALTSFVSQSCGIPIAQLQGARFEREVSFKGRGAHRRYADLAIYLADQDEPTVLIEIKYFDGFLPKTDKKPGQLSDYMTWKSKDQNRRVLILSREAYCVPGAVFKRWNVLARHLRPYATKSDLIQMLVEYLEQEGVVMQNVDGYAVMRYMKRLVCHYWKSGVLANNIDGPTEFSKLLKNLKLMSGTFERDFKQAWGSAGLKTTGVKAKAKGATIDFFVTNHVKKPTGKKTLVNDEGELNSEMKDGGCVDLSATHALGSGNGQWLRITYGIGFTISPANSLKSPPAAYCYAYATGHHIQKAKLETYQFKNVAYKKVTEKAEEYVSDIEDIFRLMVTEVLDKVVGENLPFAKSQKLALKMVRKLLSAREEPLLEAA